MISLTRTDNAGNQVEIWPLTEKEKAIADDLRWHLDDEHKVINLTVYRENFGPWQIFAKMFTPYEVYVVRGGQKIKIADCHASKISWTQEGQKLRSERSWELEKRLIELHALYADTFRAFS